MPKGNMSKNCGQKRHIAGKIFLNAIAICYTITCIVPVVWIFYSSFKTQADFDRNSISLPQKWVTDAYASLMKEGMVLTSILNSLRNAILATALTLLIAMIMGYMFQRYKFRGKRILYSCILFGFLVPVHGLLLPSYLLMSKAGILNQWFTLLFPYVCFSMPCAIFLIESYMEGVPRELEEAMCIDGASFSRRIFGLILPISTPVLTSAGIITFFYCWNEFILSQIYIREKSLWTLPQLIMSYKGNLQVNYPMMMALMLIGMIPSLLLYVLFSKQVTEGMVAGAVKG